MFKKIKKSKVTEPSSTKRITEKSFEDKLAEGTPVSQAFREEFGMELW